MSVEVENVEPEQPAMIANDADDESSCGNHSEEGGLNFSDSEPKDSGIDCSGSDQSSELPDEETCLSIMKTVEYYLSDANILKDPFLLKHVRRNKEGYVSLKLLASFRKVKSLSRNWKAVAHSIKKSTLLSMNSDGTKVRRLAPLPDYDETVTSRSLIVSGFNSDKPSVDHISEMFSKCGDIALVRILRPGGSIPSEVKRVISKNPDIQSKVSVLVEFEEHAATKKALEMTLPDGISVLPVASSKDKATPESPKKEQNSPNSSPVRESPKKKKKNRKSSNADKTQEGAKSCTINEKSRNRRSSSGSVSSHSSGYLSSSPNTNNSNIFDSRVPRRHSYHPHIYNDPNSSFASLSNRYHHGGSRDRLQRTEAENNNTGVLSPWRRRREQQMQSDSNLASSMSSTSHQLPSLPVKTIRMPRGPDGTKGFCPRVRSRLPSTAE